MNYKFYIVNEEHSKAVQNILFSLGYTWYSGDSEPLYTDKPGLVAYTDEKRIAYHKCVGALAGSSAEECYISKDEIKTVAEHILEEGDPVIKINDKEVLISFSILKSLDKVFNAFEYKKFLDDYKKFLTKHLSKDRDIKVGDYVYIPTLTNEALLVEEHVVPHLIYATLPYHGKAYFDKRGHFIDAKNQPSVWLATKTNKDRLEAFYNTELGDVYD